MSLLDGQKMYCSQREFAKECGVSPARINKLAKSGALKDATIDGTKINLQHPSAVEYYEQRMEAIEEEKNLITKPTPIIHENATADDLQNLTLRQIVMRFGSLEGFRKYVDSLKAIADFKFREQKYKQQRGELIEKEIVEKVVLPLLDTAFTRLVTDVPKSTGKLVEAYVESADVMQAEEISKIIKNANSKAIKSLKAGVLKTSVFAGD